MTTPTEKFYRRVSKQLGPPYQPPAELAGIFEDRRQLAQEWIASARHEVLPGKSFPEIHFEYFSSGTFNAIASLVGGELFIGMSLGAVLHPGDLYHRLLSHPDFLPEIGDVTKEVASEQHSDGLHRNYHKMVALRSWRPTRSPIDRVRSEFADLCGRIAFDFLFTHELVHLLHGHCREPRALFPFVRGDLLAEEATTIAALEMETDWCAAAASLEKVLDLSAHANSDLNPVINTKEKACFAWAVAIAGSHQIREMQSAAVKPPDPHRLANMLIVAADSAAALLRSLHGAQAEASISEIRRAYDVTQEATLLIGHKAAEHERASLEATLNNPAAKARRAVVRQRSKDIQGELAKTAIVQISAKLASSSGGNNMAERSYIGDGGASEIDGQNEALGKIYPAGAYVFQYTDGAYFKDFPGATHTPRWFCMGVELWARYEDTGETVLKVYDSEVDNGHNYPDRAAEDDPDAEGIPGMFTYNDARDRRHWDRDRNDIFIAPPKQAFELLRPAKLFLRYNPANSYAGEDAQNPTDEGQVPPQYVIRCLSCNEKAMSPAPGLALMPYQMTPFKKKWTMIGADPDVWTRPGPYNIAMVEDGTVWKYIYVEELGGPVECALLGYVFDALVSQCGETNQLTLCSDPLRINYIFEHTGQFCYGLPNGVYVAHPDPLVGMPDGWPTSIIVSDADD